MNTTKRGMANGRVKWLALAGLALSLTIPLSANAHFDSDDTTNLLVGAAVTYALIDAADGFDNDRNRRHQPRRRHDDRYLHARYGRPHGHSHGNAYGHRHAPGLRHTHHRAHTYHRPTRAPRWYAHR